MRRLINVTKGVTKVQAIQFWYGTLEKDLRQRVQNIVLTKPSQPTLALIFQVFEQIEFNMVEEKVVNLRFNRETPKPFSTSSTQ